MRDISSEVYQEIFGELLRAYKIYRIKKPKISERIPESLPGILLDVLMNLKTLQSHK